MYKLLISVGAWGFGNLFMKFALDHHMGAGSVLSWSIGGQFFALMLLIYFSVGPPVIRPSLAGVWAFLGGAIGLIGGYFFLEVLGQKRLAVVSPFISPLNMALTIVLGVVVLKEHLHLNVFHIIGIASALVSAVALAIAEWK